MAGIANKRGDFLRGFGDIVNGIFGKELGSFTWLLHGVCSLPSLSVRLNDHGYESCNYVDGVAC